MMMYRSILLLCSLIASTQAFAISPYALLSSPVSTALPTTTSLHMTNINSDQATTATFVSRRSALVTSAATATFLLSLVSVATVANGAVVDESADDMVKRIAAQSASANAAARAKAEKEKLEKESGSGGNSSQALVPAFLLASVGLSLPFFLPNLLRLGTKVMSGGENDGYGNKSNIGKKKK